MINPVPNNDKLTEIEMNCPIIIGIIAIASKAIPPQSDVRLIALFK